MFKKIAIITGYVLLTLGLAAYFYFSTMLTSKEMSRVVCNKIDVRILDKNDNRFVSEAEIVSELKMLGITPGESKIKHINQFETEKYLYGKNAVKRTDVSVNINGVVRVDVTQRRPILRLETDNGGFYMDDEAYIFPLVSTFCSNVPVVSGNIPLQLNSGYRGKCKFNKEWAESLLKFGIFLSNNPLWNDLTEQIYIDDKSDLYIVPRIGGQEIIFGDLEDIEEKFNKLSAFYKDIIPNEGWDKYKAVDLRFHKQIVCKLRHSKQIIDTTTTSQQIKNI